MRQVVRLFWIILSTIFTYLLVKEIQNEGGIDKVTLTIGAAKQNYLFFFALLSITGLVIRAKRAHLLFNKLSFTKLLLTFAVRTFTVDLLPARTGELVYLVLLKKFGIPIFKSSTSLLILTLTDLAILIGLMLAFYLAQFSNILGYCFGLSFGIFILKILKNGRTGYLSSEIILEMNNNSENIFYLTVLLRTLKYASLYLLLNAFTTVYFSPVHSTIAFISAEGSALLPFGGLLGFGIYEKTWTFVLKNFGYQINEPLVLAFSIHVTAQIIGYLISFIYLAYYQLISFLSRN